MGTNGALGIEEAPKTEKHRHKARNQMRFHTASAQTGPCQTCLALHGSFRISDIGADCSIWIVAGSSLA